MSTLLAVDPGVKACGIAVFENDELTYASLVPPHAVPCWHDRIVIECPQAYRASRSKGDPNDLIDLARVVGMLEERSHGRSEVVKPRTWKGQVPKDVMLKRILARLSEDETPRIPKLSKSLLHNVIDSVGIGLWALGRLKQKS